MYNDLNLLPPKMRKNKRRRIKFDNPSYGLILVVVILFSVFIVDSEMDNKKESLNEEIIHLENKINQIISKVEMLNAPSEEHRMLRETFLRIKELNDIGLPWAIILDQISYSTNPNVTITKIQNIENNKVRIDAYTHTLSDMAKMKKSFEKNNYFHNTEIISYEYKPSSIVERAAENRDPAVVFAMTFDFLNAR